jgi:salicylate 5-hydroxylase large subunit
MFENIKDPYHASLLHVFLVSFGLYRLDAPQRTLIDSRGLHAAAISSRAEQQKKTEDNADMRSLMENLTLHAPEMLQPVKEFPQYTIVLMTVWPNLIIQQQSNTLAMRQLIPRGREAFELHWTFFGYETDDEEMTQRRIRQANLMGPSGYVSMDDSEMMDYVQRGVRQAPAASGVIEMGGKAWVENEDHGVTESMIRAFYDQYRKLMDL